MGKGKISQVVTKQGVALSDWEMNYPEFPGKSGSTLTGGPTATP